MQRIELAVANNFTALNRGVVISTTLFSIRLVLCDGKPYKHSLEDIAGLVLSLAFKRHLWWRNKGTRLWALQEECLEMRLTHFYQTLTRVAQTAPKTDQVPVD